MNLKLIAEIIFWLSTAAILYAYLGYPLLLVLMSRLWGRAVRRAFFGFFGPAGVTSVDSGGAAAIADETGGSETAGDGA